MGAAEQYLPSATMVSETHLNQLGPVARLNVCPLVFRWSWVRSSGPITFFCGDWS